MPRHRTLDLVRGLGIATMVFLHASFYHYGRLSELDLSRPPPAVTLIGFLLMWAPLFAVVSGAAFAVRSAQRLQNGVPLGTVTRWNLTAAMLLIGLGVVYFALLGPTLVDLATDTRDHSLLVGLVREGRMVLPSEQRLLYMNTLHMLGFSMLLAAPIFAASTHGAPPSTGGAKRRIALCAIVVLALSWLRIPLYPLFEQALADDRGGLALALFWLVNRHDPVFPALGFFLLGNLIGLCAVAAPASTPAEQWRLPMRLAAVLLVAGSLGWLFGPDTMLARSIDWSWYAINLLQGGVLLAALSFAYRAIEAGAHRTGLLGRTLTRFGQHGLSVLFGEALLGEAIARTLAAASPGWNDTIAAALAFGAASVALWAALLAAWERLGYRCSLERGWVRLAALLGRPSTRAEPFGFTRP